MVQPPLSPTSKPLPLLQGNVTFEAAVEKDDNMLRRIAYPQQREDFYIHLYVHRREIEAIVSFHLGLCGTETCYVGEMKEWISGSFNICIPIYINRRTKFPRKRVLIRLPLPYKVGEAQCPGNADEKLRCEAAAFIWIQDNCPQVPIPYLWGFGFSSGQSFTAPENVSLWRRFKLSLRRTFLSLFGHPLPCRYISHRCPCDLTIGYLVMDYIEQENGKMLSETWDELRHDKDRRANLFRSISQLQALENEGIPTGIDRSLTYSAVEPYYLDLLACHNSRIRHQPNAVFDRLDGQAQLATLTILRALLPVFSRRDLRHGPFVFTLTDLHPSNLFVDDEWHIKFVIDLEWACSLPIEMQHPPYWLTGRGVDQLEEGEHLEAFTRMYEEFVNIFEEMERLLSPRSQDVLYRTNIMRMGWKTGNFWYFHSLGNPKGLYNLFLQNIQPMFAKLQITDTTFDELVAPYWNTDAEQVIAVKIKDKVQYDRQLREAFRSVKI